MKSLAKLTDGGHPAWSPADQNTIAFARITKNDDPNAWRKNSRQLYIKHLDTGEEQCLSCVVVPGGPSQSVNKGAPTFDPSGKYISVLVEDEEHPYRNVLGDTGPGFFQNVWFTTITGDRWWKLTNYPEGYANPDSYNRAPYWGVLAPKISPDGTKIAFTQMIEGPDPKVSLKYLLGTIVPNGNPWGVWQLNVADLVIDATGVRLENLRSSKPGDGHFYETQQWSADNQTLLVAGDSGHDSPTKLDILAVDTASGNATNLTNTDDKFEEFAAYAPDERTILYMSSCCGWTPAQSLKDLLSEYFTMDRDGQNKQDFTQFNTQGYATSDISNTIVTSMMWSKDAQTIIFEKVSRRPLSQELWKLELNAGP